MSYDAFGKRRGTANWLDDPSDVQFNASRSTTRGYTGHEMLDGLNLIHMNGRIYDPIIGRFLSADPLVQAPENTQSYNRYAYVWNNPLKYTDPSGYGVFDRIKKELSRWESDFRHEIRREDSFLGAVVQVGIYVGAAAICGPGAGGCGAGAATVILGTAALAEAQGASSTESIRAGAVAGITYGVGASGLDAPVKIAVNGAIAGTYARSQGGDFGRALAASVIGSSFGDATGGDFSVGKLGLSALIGGTVSEITGGKFANGAVTGAFQYTAQSVQENLRRSSQSERNTGYTVEYGAISTPGDLELAISGVEQLLGNSAYDQALVRADLAHLRGMRRVGFSSGELVAGAQLMRSRHESRAVLAGGAIILAPDSALGYAAASVISRQDMTVDGLLTSAVVGRSLSPVTGAAIAASGGGVAGNVIWRHNGFWAGWGISGAME